MSQGSQLERPLEGGGVLLSIDGKLRGSRARLLGARLVEIALDGAERVVLDLRELYSADSVALDAIAGALEIGLRIDAVASRSFELPELPGLVMHSTLDAALRAFRRSGRVCACA